ncbi:hypothetical protein [Streptomyces cyaneofuscatus]|uniref:Uncharacterized protein n=1 Tax=Streptomyces cyaneofuscatus TaxID=66883 RepID=A0ABZ1EZD9_9ACTN|nr:hypothetical protein [Streptomyces cyaneofuscatus]WSB09304.1 hypothetical protein OG849_19710 [Streptomyces cyaneofuscatus]WSD47160.1 hypothetical protein OG857_15690 [Streptomyces cyaneofuscatus]
MPHAYARAYCLAHLYAKFRYPPVLLVVCRGKGTAEWAAEPIRIGLEKHPSLAVFDVWFERAITAPTAEAVFDES